MEIGEFFCLCFYLLFCVTRDFGFREDANHFGVEEPLADTFFADEEEGAVVCVDRDVAVSRIEFRHRGCST